MNELLPHTLTRRLDQVERELRWWRRLATSAMALIVAVFLMGQAVPKNRTVEAEKFIVRDATGTIRAELSAESTGPTSLHFYDRDGKRPVVVEWMPEGSAGLYLQNRTATVSLTTDGWPSLYLGLEDMNTSALLAHRSLTLYEGNQTRAVLGQTEVESTPGGTLHQRPVSSLLFFDRNSDIIWQAP